MSRIASIALMASLVCGSTFVIGCDKEKASTETKTTNPDGSQSKSEKTDTVKSDGTVVHKESSTDKPADKTSTDSTTTTK